MFDFHIHMRSTKWEKGLPQEFLRKTSSAGITGGAIFSHRPARYQDIQPTEKLWREKLEAVFRFTSETPGFLPVFYIDPLESDFEKQVKTAVEQGISAFKIICNTFYPKDIIPQLKLITETGKPVIFHSGILYCKHPAGEYNRPISFECLQEVPGLTFSLAHISWPWTAELVSIAGELYYRNANAEESGSMFVDLTPGTPRIFRRNALREYFLTGYPKIENWTVWGTDSHVENYDDSYARDILSRDKKYCEEIYRDAAEYDLKPERFANLFERITSENYKSFFNLK